MLFICLKRLKLLIIDKNKIKLQSKTTVIWLELYIFIHHKGWWEELANKACETKADRKKTCNLWVEKNKRTSPSHQLSHHPHHLRQKI